MNILTSDTLSGAERGHGERNQDAARQRASQFRTSVAGASSCRRQTIEYRLLFALTFVVFVVAAIVETVISFCLRDQRRADGNEGIYQRAKFGAETCVKYAFMG